MPMTAPPAPPAPPAPQSSSTSGRARSERCARSHRPRRPRTAPGGRARKSGPGRCPRRIHPAAGRAAPRGPGAVGKAPPSGHVDLGRAYGAGLDRGEDIQAIVSGDGGQDAGRRSHRRRAGARATRRYCRPGVSSSRCPVPRSGREPTRHVDLAVVADRPAPGEQAPLIARIGVILRVIEGGIEGREAERQLQGEAVVGHALHESWLIIRATDQDVRSAPGRGCSAPSRRPRWDRLPGSSRPPSAACAIPGRQSRAGPR